MCLLHLTSNKDVDTHLLFVRLDSTTTSSSHPYFENLPPTMGFTMQVKTFILLLLFLISFNYHKKNENNKKIHRFFMQSNVFEQGIFRVSKFGLTSNEHLLLLEKHLIIGVLLYTIIFE